MRPAISAHLRHAWQDTRGAVALLKHAAHDVRVVLHLLAHHVPLFTRAAVVLAIVSLFAVAGYELTRERIFDVCAYGFCEAIAGWLEKL